MAYVVQSVLLKKPITLKEARRILAKHGYKSRKVDETEHFYRFRQEDPAPLERKGWRFRNVPLGTIGELILAYSP